MSLDVLRDGWYITGYEKGTENVYATTEPFVTAAIRRAGVLKAHFNPHTGTDPYTGVDEVVTLLRSIRPA